MLLRLGRVPTVVASSAAAAQEAMKTRDQAFASRAPVRMAERLLYGRDMVFAPYGEFWRQTRRISVLHLLSPRRVQSFRRAREQEAAALLSRVRRRATGIDGTVNLSDLLISYACGITSRAAFGDGYELDGDDSGGKKLRQVFADFEGLLGAGTVGEFVPWLAWVDTLTGLDAKARRTFRALDGLLERVLADHRNRYPGTHAHVPVSLMPHVAFQMTTSKSMVILQDMLAASIDSTYTTMERAMAERTNYPDEMRRLQDEIRAVVVAAGGDNEIVTEDHLGKLGYLKCVIKETLRLHAPVPLLVPRETVEDTEVLGFHVPARTRVVINAWAIGRDPATWERGDEFVPERFAGEYVLGQDFRFVPFVAGRRGCPGVGFAVPSIHLALANLLYHFDWELPAGGATAIGMSELFGLSVRLKATLHLIAKPWSPSP